jgi:4-amino-4-deoxy-L-arabinose transferase-like glycosyltransferase
VRQLTHRRLKLTVAGVVPSDLMLIALPAGIAVALRRDRRLCVAVAAPILFLIVYAFNPYYFEHYPAVIAPAVLILVMAGVVELARRLTQRERVRDRPGGAYVFASLTALALALAATPEVNLYFGQDPDKMPSLRELNLGLSQKVRAPAVVFFRYRPGDPFHAEPVYNREVIWPLDAAVMRVQDLGPRNVELVDFLASRQPQRTYYLFDRRTWQMFELGHAEQARELFRSAGDR